MRRLAFVGVVLAALLLLSLFVAGRGGDEAPRAESRAAGEKLVVVATLFPQYDFARQIAGDRAEVALLLPPGSESHTFEPRPADMTRIQNADVFLYTGPNMEPWADRIANSAAGGGVLIADVSQGIELLPEEEHDHNHGENHEHDHAHAHADDHSHELDHAGSLDHAHHETAGHDHGAYDPHFWLDLRLAIHMAENVEQALSQADPAGAAQYRANTAACIENLKALDADFEEAVRSGKRDVLVFGGRFAYRYFLERYNLHYVTAYQSCSTEAEPSIRDVSRVIEYMKENAVPCIYHEEFVDPKVARTIADAAGAELLLFSTAHNVTKDELEAGITFVDIMRRNLENVRRGLN